LPAINHLQLGPSRAFPGRLDQGTLSQPRRGRARRRGSLRRNFEGAHGKASDVPEADVGGSARGAPLAPRDRQVTSSQIRAALGKREALVRKIRAELARLEGAAAGVVDGVGRLERRGQRRKTRAKATPAQQAAWRAQGRYLAAVRRLSRADRQKVRAIREKDGVRAAIAAARRLA
jgi:hypothetical protein